MDYFSGHLTAGEKIIGRTRKSVYVMSRDLLLALVLAGAIAGLYLGLHLSVSTLRWIVLGAALLLLLTVLNSYVKIATTILVITTRRFMTKQNLVTIKVSETLLDNIDDVEVEYRGPIRRMMNVGDIVVRTKSTERKYKNIARPDIFASVLNGQAARLKDGRQGTVKVSFGVESGTPSVADGKDAPAAGGGKNKRKAA